MNTQIEREPLNPEKIRQEIEDTFVFNPPLSSSSAAACAKIQNACKELALLIAYEVPEGKEQTIAVNNLLSVALFARQGITRRQIAVVVTAPVQDTMPEPTPINPT